MSHTEEPSCNRLETCTRNSSYIFKTTQNALLECIKNYMQGNPVDTRRRFNVNTTSFDIVRRHFDVETTGQNESATFWTSSGRSYRQWELGATWYIYAIC